MKKSSVQKAYEDIDRGLKGLNEGVPMRFPRLDNYLCGIQQGTYYLIGGDTGCLDRNTPVIVLKDPVQKSITTKRAVDIKKDDLLLGPDNEPRRVKMLKRGSEKMYWVRQNKGDDYRVNESHILSLLLIIEEDKIEFINIKLSDYLKEKPYLISNLKGYKKVPRSNRIELTDISVEEDREDAYYGFELDGDGLFLLGDYTVTHNSGKSYLAQQMFVVDCIAEAYKAGRGIEINFFTMELQARRQVIRAMTLLLYRMYGLIVSYNEMLGKRTKLSEDYYAKVKMIEPTVEWLFSHVRFFDTGKVTHSTVEDVLAKTAEKNGVWETEDGEKVYHPNDPQKVIINIFDHIGLFSREGGQGEKQKIDDISKVQVAYRNACNFTCVDISQYNRGIQNYDRQKSGFTFPTLSDFKETGGTQEDADVVIGIHDPARYGQKEYMGYDVAKAGSRIRGLHVLKNRDGFPAGALGCAYFGEVGLFRELPKSDSFKENEELYNEHFKLK